jgi:hypothetical protein
MRIKLMVKRTASAEPEYIYTTLFCIAKWEEKFNRKIQDLVNAARLSDWTFMAYTMLRTRGEKLPDDYMDWLEQNPELEIIPVSDQTNPNPTDAELTDGN